MRAVQEEKSSKSMTQKDSKKQNLLGLGVLSLEYGKGKIVKRNCSAGFIQLLMLLRTTETQKEKSLQEKVERTQDLGLGLKWEMGGNYISLALCMALLCLILSFSFQHLAIGFAFSPSGTSGSLVSICRSHYSMISLIFAWEWGKGQQFFLPYRRTRQENFSSRYQD